MSFNIVEPDVFYFICVWSTIYIKDVMVMVRIQASFRINVRCILVEAPFCF